MNGNTSAAMICIFTLVVLSSILAAYGCGYPGSPSHSIVTYTPENIRPGTVASYECEAGFELLGPSRRLCSLNGTWTPAATPFCVLNVAAGKAPMQSSVSLGGTAERAVDGSTSGFFTPQTCSLTEPERAPWWYVNLLEPYLVQLIRLDFGKPCCENDKPATIVVRVGNNRQDLKANPVCNRFTGFLEEGRPLFLPCNPPVSGAFVSVHLENAPGNSLSICEAFVYTDQALPIEKCPQFRDQEPGSTATYNGKCYLFHNNQPLNFNEARQFCEARGGSLIDETNPALQGFISWELWRRHSRNDRNGQYWMGVRRDTDDLTNWRWLSGKDVTVSFWNLPIGNENCARYDGTKGWLWSDSNCNRRLHFICQHRPKSCGKPEQPANSTIVANNFNVGSRVEYQCDAGNMIVGPAVRTCQSTGSFSDFAPTCKYVQCGFPARIPNGSYKFVNDSRDYLSMVSYSCNDGHQLIGRANLICDVDGRWNGPPPRCEAVYCLDPPQIRNGGFKTSTNSTIAGTTVDYYCSNPHFQLSGNSRITCQVDGHYDKDPPICIESDIPVKQTIDRSDLDDPLDDSKESYYYDDYYEEADPSYPITSGVDTQVPTNGQTNSPKYPTLRSTTETTSRTKNPTIHTTTFPSTKHPTTETTSPTITTAQTRLQSSTIKITSTTSISSVTTPSTSARPSHPESNSRPETTPRSPTKVPSTVDVGMPRHTLVRISPPRNATAKPTVITRKPNNGTVIDLVDPIYLSPQDNEIADSSNAKNNVPPNVNEPTNTNTEPESGNGKINLGGIIALGVFGGFVFLAAMITTFVIVIRRIRNDERYRHRPSSESQSNAAFDSSTEDRGGLNKYYRQAWDNLREPAATKPRSSETSKSNHPQSSASSRIEPLDDPTYRSRNTREMIRDESEIVVSDVVAKKSKAEKKRHHHHHHHKHNKRSSSKRNDSEW